MIKRIPYSENMISIGNANHVPGKPVWSDGRIAYGWNYTPQKNAVAQSSFRAGLWVAELDYYNIAYKLVTNGLQAGRWIRGNAYHVGYCLPIFIDGGIWSPEIHSDDVDYTASGKVLAVDTNGKAMTFTSTQIHQYDSDGTITATTPVEYSFVSWDLNALNIPVFDRFHGNYTHIAGVYYSTTDAYDLDINQPSRDTVLARPTEAYVFRTVARFDIDSLGETPTVGYSYPVYVRLGGMSSVTLTSSEVEFLTTPGYWSDTITINAGGSTSQLISVRTISGASGIIHATYTITTQDEGTLTITGDIQLVTEYGTKPGLFAVAESHIDNTGALANTVFPQFWELCPDVKLQMFDDDHDLDMSLCIGDDIVISDDPLGILTGNSTPNHLSALVRGDDILTADIYIADSKRNRLWLYKNNEFTYTDDYTGLSKCYNLVWLKEKL